MSQYKKNKVYFYKLRPKISDPDKVELQSIKENFKKAFLFSESKEVKVSDGTVSGVRGEVLKNRFIGGAIIFTLEENLPPRYNLEEQKPAEIELEGYNGLGYDSAYVYDPELMVFAFESRRPGATLNNVQSLLFMNNDLPGFDYVPIADSNAYQQFLESNGVKSLKMKMLRVSTESDNIAYERGVKEIKDFVDEMNGAQITIHVTAGRKKGGYLDKKRVQGFAQHLLNKVGLSHPIERFELKIEDVDSGKIVPIDLISGRIFEWTQIEKVRLINQFSIKEKINQISDHLVNKNDIIRTFLNE